MVHEVSKGQVRAVLPEYGLLASFTRSGRPHRAQVLMLEPGRDSQRRKLDLTGFPKFVVPSA